MYFSHVYLLQDAAGPLFLQTEDFVAGLCSDHPQLDIIIQVSDARRGAFDRNIRKAYLQVRVIEGGLLSM